MKYLFSLVCIISSVNLLAQTPQFKEVSAVIGINHFHDSGNPEMGSGVLFFDVNNDHWEDLFFIGGWYPNRLYLNQGDGNFEDITTEAGIILPTFEFGNGAASGDFDNDGFRDLFITTHGGTHNYLFRNKGNNTFEDVTLSSGVAYVTTDSLEIQQSFSPTLGDFNLDGYLDIYINNWMDEHGFIIDTVTNKIIGFTPKGGTNRLYLNNGDWTFSEVALDYGVADIGCSLSSVFSDYDLDRDLDILVANDFGEWWRPDALYQNQYPNPYFKDLSDSSQFNTAIYGMGIGVGDYDQDGDLDYYKTSIGSHVLMQNQLDGTFEEVAETAGVKLQYIDDQPPFLNVGWGTGFCDLDNDTWLDLVVAQGALLPHDYFLPSLDSLTDKIFHNNADGTFTDISHEFDVPNIYMSRGLAYGDYDNDGDIDLAFSNNTQLMTMGYLPAPPAVYKNQLSNENNYLKIKLEGTRNNRDGLGTHIKMYVNGQSWLHEVGSGGQGHNSQHSSVAHFGLGTAAVVDSVVVSWLGNLTPPQTFYDIPANQFIKIVEGKPDYETIQLVSTHTNGIESAIERLFIFPNPATQSLNYQVPNLDAVQSVQLFDVFGKLVKVATRIDGQLSLENLNAGMYVLVVETEQALLRKMVVKN